MAKPHARPPTDEFMGMLDLAWQDFKTYREAGDDSRPRGLAVILVGQDSEGCMTIKTGANIDPGIVELALVRLVCGFATGDLVMDQVPGVKEKEGRMTPQEFKRIRHGLLLTQKELAEVLGYAHKIRISEYERETNPVPIPDHIADAMWKMSVTDSTRLPQPAVREWQRHAE